MPSPLAAIGKRLRSLSTLGSGAVSESNGAVNSPEPSLSSSSVYRVSGMPITTENSAALSILHTAQATAVVAVNRDTASFSRPSPTHSPARKGSMTAPLKFDMDRDSSQHKIDVQHKRRWSTPQLHSALSGNSTNEPSSSTDTRPSIPYYSAASSTLTKNDSEDIKVSKFDSIVALKRRTKSEPIFTEFFRIHRQDSLDIDALLTLGSQAPQSALGASGITLSLESISTLSPLTTSVGSAGLAGTSYGRSQHPLSLVKHELMNVGDQQGDADKFMGLGSQSEIIGTLLTAQAPSHDLHGYGKSHDANISALSHGTASPRSNMSGVDNLIKHRRSSIVALAALQTLQLEIKGLKRSQQVYVKHANDISDFVDTSTHDETKLHRIEQILLEHAKKSVQVVTTVGKAKVQTDIDEVLGMSIDGSDERSSSSPLALLSSSSRRRSEAGHN